MLPAGMTLAGIYYANENRDSQETSEYFMDAQLARVD